MRYYILIFLILGFFQLNAQNYSKLIEKGAYKKAGKKLSKKIEKDPFNVELLYFYSVLKYKVDAGEYFDISSSYDTYLEAKQGYTNINDIAVLEKLTKIPINIIAFRALSDSICRIAFEHAKSLNTEEAHIYYLSKYDEAPSFYKEKAVLERNRLGFKNAVTENTFESFTLFINKYPKAIQIEDAWKNIHRIEYDKAKELHSIEAYQTFIRNYPSADQRNDAQENIHTIAFEKAKEIDNSKAYKSFIDRYPSSKQNEDALGLFYNRQFGEETNDGDWICFKEFYENFNGPYRAIALDNISSFAANGNFQSLKYLIKNNLNSKNMPEMILSHFETIKYRCELSELSPFYNLCSSYLDDKNRLDLENRLLIAKISRELKFDEEFKKADRKKYIDFIKVETNNELSFVALQRIISTDIRKKNFKNALRTINELEDYLAFHTEKINELKELLRKEYDTSIILKSIDRINTEGDEYSPVISADNKTIFFCTKSKNDNESLENLIKSNNEYGAWSTPQVLDLIKKETNTAPLANSADGNSIFLFSEGDIYESIKSFEGWTRPLPMSDFINTKSWEGDLTISSDNKTLIFARGNAETEKNIEIVFLVDATGSMNPCIRGVQQNIYNFISGLQSRTSELNWRAKIIYYRDFEEDASSYITNEFTDNIEILEQQLNHRANGGGDEPESTIEALYKSLEETPWDVTGQYSRVIINFTDATNKDFVTSESKRTYGLVNWETLREKLEQTKVKLFLFGQRDPDYAKLDGKWAEINLYDYAVDELQNADYKELMGDLSIRVSLLSSNTQTYHGDRLPKSDLLIMHKDKNGRWLKPKKMSSILNTEFTERSPFLHPDMRTLYFSSDGHGGIGKLDVYVSKRLADTCWDCWSEPVNLGKEINGPNSDWGYKISTDGKVAYFSKDSETISGEDLYSITLPAHLRPDVVAKIEGTLKDLNDNPVAASIRWEDLESNKVIGTAKSDPSSGEYFIVLPMGKNYGYFIEDTAYFPISRNLDLRNKSDAIEVSNEIVAVTFQEMIEKKIPIPMNNLFFEFGKSTILRSSIPELRRVADIIKSKNLSIELSGHTDNVGSASMNQKLSEDRAKSVKEFLIQAGVETERIITEGYGFSIPVDTNETEEGRSKNRRVEIRLSE